MSDQNRIEFPAIAALPHAPLENLRVIRASGADAMSFLQAQLSHDVAALVPEGAALAAYCNAKGRTQASVVVWCGEAAAEAPELYLLVSADLADALVKRLRMFVLRAKVVLELTDHKVTGLWVNHDEPANWPQPGKVATLANGAGWLVRAATSGSRAWCIHEPSLAFTSEAQAADAWWLAQIRAGLPWVTQATFELFTPLAINFDLIDGVSFTKGCYPGQEVVARSHYRGKQRRRTVRGSVEGNVAAPHDLPGSDVHSIGAREPVGRVINVAQHDGVTEILFEARYESLEPDNLRLGSVEGPIVRLETIPYALSGESGQ